MKKRKGNLPGRYVGAHLRKHPKHPSEYVDVSAYQEKEEPAPAKFENPPVQKELELKRPGGHTGRIVGSHGIVSCTRCNNDQFEILEDQKSDEVLRCRCGSVMGPYFSLVAFANGEGHTAVNANLQPR